MRNSLSDTGEFCLRYRVLLLYATHQGIKKGLAEGLAEGRAEGRVEGVDLMAKLVKILLAGKKYSDVEKASDDAEYRDKLLKEYKLVG